MLPVPRSGLATHVDTRLLVPGGPSPAQRVPEPPDPASPPSPRASRPGLPAVSPRLPTRLPRHLPESPDLASPPSPRASRPGFRAVSPSLLTWPPRRLPEPPDPASPPCPRAAQPQPPSAWQAWPRLAGICPGPLWPAVFSEPSLFPDTMRCPPHDSAGSHASPQHAAAHRATPHPVPRFPHVIQHVGQHCAVTEQCYYIT